MSRHRGNLGLLTKNKKKQKEGLKQKESKHSQPGGCEPL